MNARRNQVEVFLSNDGRSLFEVWFQELKDPREAAEVLVAVDELAAGRFDGCRSIGCGVFEKRINTPLPRRIFFALVGAEGLIILSGSNDESRKEGAEKALKIWKEFKDHAH